MIIFVNIEKNPNVKKLSGAEKKFNIGLTIKKSSDNASPPIINEGSPPETLTPVKIMEIK